MHENGSHTPTKRNVPGLTFRSGDPNFSRPRMVKLGGDRIMLLGFTNLLMRGNDDDRRDDVLVALTGGHHGGVSTGVEAVGIPIRF